ncbi:MAG: hypothetical protein RI884_1194 [Pseudomonadota bacterium]
MDVKSAHLISRATPLPATRPLFAITACVALLHAAALWALHAGLQRPEVPATVAVTLVTELRQEAAALPTPPRPPSALAPQAAAQARRSTPPPQTPTPTLPAPGAAQALAPATTSNTAPATAAPAALSSVASPSGATPAPSATAGSPTAAAGPGVAPVRVEWPSSDADYLRNPRPAYPVQSRRLGEQGQVIVHVLIGADGLPQKAQVHQTSGHDRLDQAALATVLGWRYVPGKRGGVPEAMWFNVPINFVLE